MTHHCPSLKYTLHLRHDTPCLLLAGHVTTVLTGCMQHHQAVVAMARERRRRRRRRRGRRRRRRGRRRGRRRRRRGRRRRRRGRRRGRRRRRRRGRRTRRSQCCQPCTQLTLAYLHQECCCADTGLLPSSVLCVPDSCNCSQHPSPEQLLSQLML